MLVTFLKQLETRHQKRALTSCLAAAAVLPYYPSLQCSKKRCCVGSLRIRQRVPLLSQVALVKSVP